jgi:multidrug efflux pump subunit AcrA (membrane-fusion protein)
MIRGTVQVTVLKNISLLLLLLTALHSPLSAQNIRERMRLEPRGTTVSGAQASDVTLTLSAAAIRPIQQIVRTGGTIDKSRKLITAVIGSPEGKLIQVGQRVRSFPPESKSSMYQARVTRVTPKDGKTIVEASLSGEGVEGRINYVMEITVDRGEFLCIPSEAIIEEGDRRVVYVAAKEGSYVPRKIDTGVQGELYTQILGGLSDGDQVVTFGSFFIDSEYKLKLSDQEPSH